MAEVILGIDLGTTFSTAAAVVGGRVHFALDNRGEACVPSVVHFPKSGPPLVGADADRLRASDPQHTVFGIKRLIGRPADSPSARILDVSAAFRIKPQPGAEAAVEVRSGTYSASEIAAILLRYLRERAEARFGRRIGKAVLTVPVSATPEVREAMARCGRMAGLEVLRFVSEPCAGVVAQGIGGAVAGPMPVLVYDFGGGTFDTAVVQRSGQQLRVLASGGDDCLGGDDLDLAFARFVASGIYRVNGVDVTRDVILWDRIQRQCEMVKRALSTAPEARFLLKDALGVAQGGPHLDYKFHRDHLAPHWAELVDRSLQATAATLRQAQLTPGQLGAVLLVGGTTYVAQVRSAVAQAFPRPSVAEEEPQTAVARGAAQLAAQPELLAE